MEVVQSIGSPLDAGFRELRLQKMEKRDSCSENMATWIGWYREAVHALVSRWRTAVDVDGDYVEKVTRVKETSGYTVREFRTFSINIFR